MRKSRQRDAILAYVKGSVEHPTADMIYEAVKNEIPNISLGTVYRNLSQLVDEGFITVVETSDKKVHYEGNLNEHVHLLCKNCCNITDVFMKSLVPDVFGETGFHIESQKTVYYGICKECQNT
jgi:Fur family peroxide stress response transcriptional regulator